MKNFTMSKLTFILTMLIVFCFGKYGFSQHHPHEHDHDHNLCKTSHVMKEHYKKHPKAKQEAMQFSKFTKSFVQKNGATKAGTTYIIPVVFHVYGNDFHGMPVTDEIVQSALDLANTDFAGLNDDFNTVDPEFLGRRATLNIEFRLAKIDPDGNPTTGVIYHPEKSGYGNGSGYDAQIQADAWDNYKYFNIYIQLDLYNDGATNNSGVCWYPDTWMSDNNLARMVFNGAYLGDNSYSQQFASSFTHEIGHYLNLIHTFENGCDPVNDEVDDTPVCDNAAMGCNHPVNCNGNRINSENYMDYNTDCYSMFTQGQVARMIAALEHPARKPLWQQSNLEATGVLGNLGPLVNFSAYQFNEHYNNDGTIETQITATLQQKQFATTGQLSQGTHYTVANVPAGLSVSINATTATTATVTLTGTASNHVSINSIANLNISFLASAFSDNTLNGFFNPSTDFRVSYIDPYEVVYNNITDFTVNASSTWQWFSFEVGDAQFGAWFDDVNGNKLRIEAYEKDMVCVGTTKNIKPLAQGTTIGTSSNWVTGGAYPDQHDINNSSYTNWNGQTAFIGTKFTINGRDHYGWIKASVSADGQSLTIMEYAYNERPYASINAGELANPTLGYDVLTLNEGQANDGTISGSIALQLFSDTWSKSSGNLIYGTDYSITNVPVGLTPVITVTNSTNAVLSFTGVATSHTSAQNADMTITFNNTAFSSNNASQVAGYTNQLSIVFVDAYQIIYEDIADITADASTTWTWFALDNDIAFGAWFDDVNANKLRIEAYERPMVTIGSTTNLAYIAENTVIGPSSNWVNGGAYPDEHDLRNATHTDWDGKTGYVGFSFDMNGYTNYGWLEISVNSNGTAFTVLSHAYNQTPNGSIRAGQTSLDNDIVINAPTNLAETNVTKNSFDVSWTAATGNVTITGYEVYLDGTLNQTVTGTQAQFSNLTPETVYNVNIKAFDVDGNKSSFSSSLSVTTLEDIDLEAPTTPQPTVSDITKTSVTLSWAASSDNKGVEGYKIYKAGVLVASITNTLYAISGLTPDTEYTYTVSAFDAAGNESSQSADVVFTTLPDVVEDPYCISQGNSVTYEWIESVNVADQTNTSDAQNYTDFTSVSFDLSTGDNAVELTPGFSSSSYTEYWSIWIDLNKDGVFDESTELVFGPQSSNAMVSGNIVVPAGFEGTTTRMRVSMKYNGAPSPCETFSYGEVEDYTVTIQGITPVAPVAIINANTNVVTEGNPITFADASTNETGTITSWEWTFEGATPASSSSQNPGDVVFNTAGTKTVSLTVTNSYGLENTTTMNITVNPDVVVEYCTATHALDYGYIEVVELNNLSNTSNWGTNGYEDYTSMSAHLEAGQAYSLNVNCKNQHWANNNLGVWIDWNNNGVFTDAGEHVFAYAGTGPYVTSVAVPSNASGNYRMRIRLQYYDEAEPCGHDTYFGEAEDYTITVSGAAPAQPAGPVAEVMVYPIPANDKLNIQLINADKANFKLMSLSGKIIINKELNSSEESIDVSNIQVGMYLLNIRTSDNTIIKKIIIK